MTTLKTVLIGLVYFIIVCNVLACQYGDIICRLFV